MKNFINDYIELNKESCRFMKKHPIGMAVTVVASYAIGAGIGAAIYYKDEIKDKIQDTIEKIKK